MVSRPGHSIIWTQFSRSCSRAGFHDIFSVGGDVRYYYKKLETTTANSAGFDVGGMLHLEPEAGLPSGSPIDLLRLAVVVRNIAAKYPWSTGDYWGKYGYLRHGSHRQSPGCWLRLALQYCS